MFAPGQESKEDIKAGEAQANQTVRMAVTGGVLLYLCTSIPSRHIIGQYQTNRRCPAAPFAIDFIKKFL
ncbi:uncharacterized protein BDW70DRAFT_125891 [Aspergillus foveolatus]|uniref:uncharacterized protein n=1 Tax=Aspergillus foveolatus TaxID=210207 RepID=UPI003CCE23AF